MAAEATQEDDDTRVAHVRDLSAQLAQFRALQVSSKAWEKAGQKAALLLAQVVDEEGKADHMPRLQTAIATRFKNAKNPREVRDIVHQLLELSNRTDDAAVLAMNVLARYQRSQKDAGSVCALCLTQPSVLTASHTTPNAIIRLMGHKMHAPNTGDRTTTAQKFSAHLLCSACEAIKEHGGSEWDTRWPVPGERFFLKLSRELIKNDHFSRGRQLPSGEAYFLYHYAASLFFTGIMSSVDLFDTRRGQFYREMLAHFRAWLRMDRRQQQVIEVEGVVVRLFVLPALPVTHQCKKIHHILLTPVDPMVTPVGSDGHFYLVAPQHFFWFVAYRQADEELVLSHLKSTTHLAAEQLVSGLSEPWDVATALSPRVSFNIQENISRAVLFPDAFVAVAALHCRRRELVDTQLLDELHDANKSTPLMILADSWAARQDTEPCMVWHPRYNCCGSTITYWRSDVFIFGTAPLWVVTDGGVQKVVACTAMHNGTNQDMFAGVELPSQILKLTTADGVRRLVSEVLACPTETTEATEAVVPNVCGDDSESEPEFAIDLFD